MMLHGDCVAAMQAMEANSVDAIVTDPPAGISFMGKTWDGDKGGRDQWVAWLAEVMREALRVLKPGGHAFVWALPRTSHWTALALEDAGFEIRDRIAHIFGSGFPKSLSVSKAIDKAAGAERVVVGSYRVSGNALTSTADKGGTYGVGVPNSPAGNLTITAPSTPEAAQWDGWGTALKPATEDWWLARKPLSEPTVAANVLKHGTGALNIDAGRVGYQNAADRREDTRGVHVAGPYRHAAGTAFQKASNPVAPAHAAGRWPANILLSHSLWCADDGCDESCPIAKLGEPARFFAHCDYSADEVTRFRYVAKASRRDRGEGNTHPTCKPTALMRYLVQLITPPGGVVLDPFAGSGTTGVACAQLGVTFIGIEREAEYVTIAERRIQHAKEAA